MSILFASLVAMGLHLVSTHSTPQNCSAQYQAALQEVFDIKNKCEDAVFKDCCQVLETAQLVESAESPPSGVYLLVGPVCQEIPFIIHHTQQARCDMDVDDGGWMVIQRRVSGGTENFDRTWKEYENGFGNLDGDFWYGLRNIHCLAVQYDVELRIDTVGTDGIEQWGVYQNFSVAGSDQKYQLNILGEAEGSAGYDYMISYHNGQPFTTYDYDNDNYGSNCAETYKGGWWFDSCAYITLNGARGLGFFWYNGSITNSLASSEMKIRPMSCSLKID